MGAAILDFVSKIVPSIIAALVASWFAVHLALARYKNEAIWSKKLEAYTKILEALHVSRLDCEQALEEEASGLIHNEEGKEVMRKRVANAYYELQKIIDTGSLIISQEATDYLKEKLAPRRDDWVSDPAVVFHEDQERILSEALEHIKKVARQDLKK